MKRIVLYDRHELHDGKIPEVHKAMVDDIKKNLTKDGDEVVAVFIDNCSEHIPLHERPEFCKLFKLCSDNEEIEVHVTTMSRISRRISWIAKMCEEMHNLGYVVTFENEGVTSHEFTKSPIVEKVHNAVKQVSEK